jgi:hypothetical protein
MGTSALRMAGNIDYLLFCQMNFLKNSYRWDEYPGVNGGVFLHDGLATGMETIHRVGDATLSNTDTVIFFESDCGINNVRLFLLTDITRDLHFLYPLHFRLHLATLLALFSWISDRLLQ